jgi:hypothetical protein
MEKEWWQLTPKLRMIVTYADYWGVEHGEEPTWTDFIRTDAEQLALYEAEVERLKLAGFDPIHAISKKTSVHIFGRGADMRPFKNEHLNTLFGIEINKRFPYDPIRPKMLTALRHEGSADHFHIQSLT